MTSFFVNSVHSQVFSSDLALSPFMMNQINPDQFLKKENIEIPRNIDTRNIESLIYGNKKYGYFEISESYKISQNKIDFKFYPPGFKSKIKFYLNLKNRKPVKVAEKKYEEYAGFFKSFFPRKLSGRFKVNYFSVVLGLRIIKDHKVQYYLTPTFILNKFGEIVWGSFKMNKPTLFMLKKQNKIIMAAYPSMIFHDEHALPERRVIIPPSAFRF